MSQMKIGALLLVSAVVACILYLIIAIATPDPEPDAALGGWHVLAVLLLIYWLGAAVAGAILVLVNFLNSRRNGRSVFDLWPSSRRSVEPQSAPPDQDDRPRLGTSSVRDSVFCNKCGAQNRRGQRFCDGCESPLPV